MIWALQDAFEKFLKPVISRAHWKSWQDQGSWRYYQIFCKIGKLEAPSNIKVLSVISKIRPNSLYEKWFPNQSKILVISMIAIVPPGTRSDQWSRRTVHNLGDISDLGDPSKILVRSIISTICPRTFEKVFFKSRPWSQWVQWYRTINNVLGKISDLEVSSKTLVWSVVSELQQRELNVQGFDCESIEELYFNLGLIAIGIMFRKFLHFLLQMWFNPEKLPESEKRIECNWAHYVILSLI